MAEQKKLRQSYAELNQSVERLSGQVRQLQQVIASNAEVLSAVVSILGEDTVTAEVARLAQERQQKQEEQMAAGVKMLVDAGVLKPAAVTGEDTLVVGAETLTSGQLRRVQFEGRAISVELREKFYGKKPGDTVENNGFTMTVTEVYTVDKARAAEYQQEQATKAVTEFAKQVEAAATPSAEAVNAQGAQADAPSDA